MRTAGCALLDEAARLFARGCRRPLARGCYNQRGVLIDPLRASCARPSPSSTRPSGRSPARPRWTARNVLLNRGSAEMLLGELARARARPAAVLALARDAGLPMLQWMALHNLGYVDFLRGDLPRRWHAWTRPPSSARRAHAVEPARSGRVLIEAGLVREADEALARAARSSRARPARPRNWARPNWNARGALSSPTTSPVPAGWLRVRATVPPPRQRRVATHRRAACCCKATLPPDVRRGRLVEPALRLRAEFGADGLTVPRPDRRADRRGGAAWRAGSGSARPTARRGSDRRRRDDPITGRLHARYVARRARSSAAGGARPRPAPGPARPGRTRRATRPASAASTCIPPRRCTVAGWPSSASTSRCDARTAGAVFAAAERARAVSSRLPAVRPRPTTDRRRAARRVAPAIEALRGAEQDRAGSRAAAAPASRAGTRDRRAALDAGRGRRRPLGRRRWPRSRRRAMPRRTWSPASMFVGRPGRCTRWSSTPAGSRSSAWARSPTCSNRSGGCAPTSTCSPSRCCRRGCATPPMRSLRAVGGAALDAALLASAAARAARWS